MQRFRFNFNFDFDFEDFSLQNIIRFIDMIRNGKCFEFYPGTCRSTPWANYPAVLVSKIPPEVFNSLGDGRLPIIGMMNPGYLEFPYARRLLVAIDRLDEPDVLMPLFAKFQMSIWGPRFLSHFICNMYYGDNKWQPTTIPRLIAAFPLSQIHDARIELEQYDKISELKRKYIPEMTLHARMELYVILCNVERAYQNRNLMLQKHYEDVVRWHMTVTTTNLNSYKELNDIYRSTRVLMHQASEQECIARQDHNIMEIIMEIGRRTINIIRVKNRDLITCRDVCSLQMRAEATAKKANDVNELNAIYNLVQAMIYEFEAVIFYSGLTDKERDIFSELNKIKQLIISSSGQFIDYFIQREIELSQKPKHLPENLPYLGEIAEERVEEVEEEEIEEERLERVVERVEEVEEEERLERVVEGRVDERFF